MTGCVHFIYLGGPFRWQHWRAIETARVHNAPVVVWFTEPLRITDDAPWPLVDRFERLTLPDELHDHPIQLANVKDWFMWRILYDHGGMYLDLDTISLRPAWDLLGDGEVCVSREYPEGDTHPHPHNAAVVIARQGAPVLAWCHEESRRLLDQGESTWGALGPHLLTSAVEEFPDAFRIAPYRALNGWSYHNIGDYYREPRDPGDEVRVIHLYSSDHLDEFHADTWVPGA